MIQNLKTSKYFMNKKFLKSKHTILDFFILFINSHYFFKGKLFICRKFKLKRQFSIRFVLFQQILARVKLI